MPINENLKKTLFSLHETASKNPAGYHTFANPKAPAISNLINSGHLLADHTTKDAADAAKVAVTLSDTGKADLGLGVPAPAPAGPSFGGTAQEGTQAGQEGPIADGTQAPTAVLEDKKKRGSRVTPIIATGLGRFVMPEITDRRKGGKKANTYPFATLEAPNEQGMDAFHVAATEAMPNPAKTLGGTVASANKRHKKEGAEPKAFKVIPGDHPVTGVPGAMVYRVK
jgi:hypothetical protein